MILSMMIEGVIALFMYITFQKDEVISKLPRLFGIYHDQSYFYFFE